MSNHEMLDLAPLHALDALESGEQRQFEAHLETCTECEASLAGYREVASNLVHDQPADDETWQRIIAAIAIEDESDGAEVVEMPRSRSGNGRMWLTTVAAVAAVVFGTLYAMDGAQGEPLDSDGIVAAAEQVADRPGSFIGDFLVEEVAVAQVILSDDGRGFLIPTDELDPLDETRSYQLWVINDTEDVISAGVLGNDPDPATFTWTGAVTGFALTREVAGGVVSSEGDVVSVIANS